MAQKFSITGQINLTAPSNLRDISRDIKDTLSKTKITLNNIGVSRASLRNLILDLRRIIGNNVSLKLNLTSSSTDVKRVITSIQNQVGKTPILVNIKAANAQQVAKEIEDLLKSKIVPINLQIKNVPSVNKASQATQSLSNNLNDAESAMENLGKQTANTIRRFGIYTIATAAFFELSSSIRQGVKDAIDFEAQIIKIRQVTGESIFSLQKLSNTVSGLATSFGVSSAELLNAGQVLSQAGFTANQVNIALNTLAKADLSPTFNSITEATEGAIAVLNQFGLEVEDLEGTFDSLNTVAAKFAVESDDLITAIRTAGGAFAAAGGDVSELEALFTAVRQTTRASASSIAVGLKTITTRLQRGRTQNFLKDLGIDLRFAGDEARKLGKEGLFVGVFESIRRISESLSKIPTTDPRFAQIAEELGGFRQIDKVIPLLTEFELAERVRGEAIRSTGSLTKDAAIAQESLANQIAKVREEFNALVRTFVQDNLFQNMTRAALEVVSALIKLAETFKNVLLPLAAASSLSIAPLIGQLGSSIKGNLFQGRFPFATGGSVPGIGDKDTVPAILTPGEFVIKKDAAKKLGRQRLDILNQGKIPGFNKGGLVGVQRFASGGSVGGAIAIGGGLLLAVNQLEDDFSSFGKELKDVIGILTGAGVQFLLFRNLLDSANPIIQESGEQYKKSTEAIDALFSDIDLIREKSNSQRSQIDIPSKKEIQDSVDYIRGAKLNEARAIINNDPKALAQAQQDILSGNDNLRGLLDRRKTGREQLLKINQLEKDSVDGLTDRIRNEELLAKQSFETGKSLQNLNKYIGGAAVAVQAFGQFLENYSQRQLESLRAGETINQNRAKNAAGIGSAATSGAIATLGSLTFLPTLAARIGTIIPAFAALASAPVLGVATALIGVGSAAYGLIKGFEEFDKEVRSIEISNTTNELSKVLSSISSGESNVRIQSGAFSRLVGDLRSRLGTETDSSNRTDINAAINNNIQGIQDFINAAKQASVTLEEFDSIVPIDFLEFFARRTGQSFDDLRVSIEETIKSQTKFNDKFLERVANAQAFETRIRTEIVLTNVIRGTVSGLERLNSSLRNITEGSFNTNQTNSLTNSLSSIGSIQDIKKFTSELQTFANSFGPAADDLISDTVDSAKALQTLPSLLLQIRRSDPFGSGGDLLTNLGDELNSLGFSKDVRDIILSQLGEIGGPNQDDSKIIDAITNDLGGVVSQISNALENVGSSLKEANDSILKELGSFATGLEGVNEGILASTGRRLNALSLQTTLGNIVNRRPNFGQQQATLNSQQNILTGGANSNQLLSDLVSSQQRLIALNKQIEETTDIDGRKALIQAQAEQALKIKQVNAALDFMSDATRRASVLESQLNKERSDRANRASFAENIAFGTNDSNRGLVRNVAFAREAARSGNLSAVPEEFRQELLSFLKQIGDTQFGGLGGLTGQDIIDRIVRNNLGAANVGAGGILDPSKTEQTTVDQIRQIFQEAQNIENQRANLELQNSQAFLQNLNSSFKSFLQNLRDTIVAGRRASIDENILAREGDLAQAQGLQATGQRLQELSGIDPGELRNNFNNIIDAFNTFESIINENNKLNKLNSGSFGVFTGIEGFIRSSLSDGKGNAARSNEEGLKEISLVLDKLRGTIGEDLTKRVSVGIFEEGGLSNIQSGFGKNSPNKIAETITELVNNIVNSNKKLLEDNQRTLDDLSRNVGGIDNLSSITGNREEISRLISSLPERVVFTELNSTITNLTNEIRVLRQTRAGFNSGGIVPGSGNTDTVPAMLTPGEFVIRKSAVERLGVSNLSRINSGLPVQKFNSGGLVQQASISSLNGSVSSFLSGINRIVDGLKNIPSQIEMTGNHRVEVVINGGQALATMMPSISKLVQSEINRSINKLINDRFPEQGPFNA